MRKRRILAALTGLAVAAILAAGCSGGGVTVTGGGTTNQPIRDANPTPTPFVSAAPVPTPTPLQPALLPSPTP